MTAQSIAASMFGTGLGVLLSPVIGSASVDVLAAFVPLSLLWYSFLYLAIVISLLQS